jgi:hypothetical protein
MPWLECRTGAGLFRLALLVALSAPLFACSEEPTDPVAGDDDDQTNEAPATADDDTDQADDDQGETPGASDKDAGPRPAARDGGTPTRKPDASGPKPDPLIDAGGELPGSGDRGDGGGEPFDPAETPDDAGVPREDLGVGNGSDVVTIGDSWMDYALSGGGIEAALRKEGKRYRNYSVSGTTLGSGAISGQFDRAKRANADIKTVVMTGGGNDIMFSGACNSNADRCADAGAMIVKLLNDLWTKLADAGVKDVVYIQYASSAGTARMRPDGGASGMGAVVAVCTSGKIRCHSIPTSDLVASRDLLDGIHPNSGANTRIAKRVLETMEKRGVRR